MNTEIINMILSDKKTQLSELQERLQVVQNALERTKFEENMYYYLQKGSKYADEFAKKEEESKNVIGDLSSEEEDLIKEIRILEIETNFVEKCLN